VNETCQLCSAELLIDGDGELYCPDCGFMPPGGDEVQTKD